jgi:hypothetical protein
LSLAEPVCKNGTWSTFRDPQGKLFALWSGRYAYIILIWLRRPSWNSFNVMTTSETLLIAVRDAFDFANREDILNTIERVPRQAQVLTLMLQHVCGCCDFIQSYAADSEFCM